MTLKKVREQLKLYLVTDRGLAGDRNFDEIILNAIDGGVTIVQLREKKMDAREFLEKANQLMVKLKKFNIPLIINDRVDVAHASNADGVHVGQSDLPLNYSRNILGNSKIIGVSVTTVTEAVEAEKLGADYIAVSPVFDTPTKTDTDPAVGLKGIKTIRGAVKIPIVGIGGINKSNTKDVIKAGCDGIAIVSAIMAAHDPKKAAGELLVEIEKGLKERKN